MEVDDVVYSIAMLGFASLPVLSMLSRSRQGPAKIEPGRIIAVVAFLLLLALQLRKGYYLGIGMVMLNTSLRLLELLVMDDLGAVIWRWTAQPRLDWRRSRTEAAVLFCVFGISGSSAVATARWITAPLVLSSGWRPLRGAETIIVTSALYPAVLLVIGTVVGRHHFCARVAHGLAFGWCPCRTHSKRELSSSRTREV